MPFRNMLVRMYYAVEPGKKTPSPFAEFRVFHISEKPITNYREEFVLQSYNLEFMEWLFVSVMKAMLSNTIFYEIEGTEENREIDNDEALQNLKSTRLKEPKLCNQYRYVRFIRKDFSDREFTEKQILEIERERLPILFGQVPFHDYLEVKKDRKLIGLAEFRYYMLLLRKGI
jgi:hypothetical protein